MLHAFAHTPLETTAGTSADGRETDASPGAPRPHEALAGWLSLMLDEVDYPMLLVNPRLALLFANRMALALLRGRHPLVLSDGRLSVRSSQDEQPFREGVDAAMQRGFRRLVRLNHGGAHPTWAAVMPLRQDGTGEGSNVGQIGALVVLAKPRMSQRLSVQSFGRLMHLTSTESSVLEMLCEGMQPSEVAQRHEVSVSTVRSQIYTLRSKVSAGSICDLMRCVALLPPILGVLDDGSDGAEAITVRAPKSRSPSATECEPTQLNPSFRRQNIDSQPKRYVHRVAA